IRMLEVGVQAGGFAVPGIVALHTRPTFTYTGVDKLLYTNAVPLRYVESYLRRVRVTPPLPFVEGDSTTVVRPPGPHSLDFVLLDHYKPKYPVDLLHICANGALSAHGTIVLHDVLTHAAPDWPICEAICRAYGYRWWIDSDVSQGAAIVTRDANAPRAG